MFVNAIIIITRFLVTDGETLQGILTEREGSLQLTSLCFRVQIRLSASNIEAIFLSLTKRAILIWRSIVHRLLTQKLIGI
jgi:hypothetical protein